MTDALVGALLGALGGGAIALGVSWLELRRQRAAMDTLLAAFVSLSRSLPGADQRWFWTPEWQAGEEAADAQLHAGETTFFNSDDEFVSALEARAQTGIGSSHGTP